MSGSSKWISMNLAANSRTGKGADQRCGSPTRISPAPIERCRISLGEDG